MTKKHFIALADTIIAHNAYVRSIWGPDARMAFQPEVIDALANWCGTQNARFDRARWLAYIAGECGPNGGRTCKG